MKPIRFVPALLGLIFGLAIVAQGALAAPYAALVMDARTGEVLHARNADTRLHPASLTKMMTLYIAFEALRLGEIDLDTRVTISRNAAAEPPSELGLRAGDTIRFRYLIRAAAVRSANDAATAIGEAIEGSEAAFARRMTRTAEALGMTRTTFRNAHGLTAEGHMSTARDMTLMGRRLFYHYPQYYNLFSRRSTDAGIATVYNTNRRFLNAYEGADGIKTGYTRAAGFNLTGSARRGQVRIIATVFGGRSTAWRNQRMAELLDMGFARAPATATVRRPSLPSYEGSGAPGPIHTPSGAVAVSLIPVPRPSRGTDARLLAAIDAAVGEALTDPDPDDALGAAEAALEPTAQAASAAGPATGLAAEVAGAAAGALAEAAETTVATQDPSDPDLAALAPVPAPRAQGGPDDGAAPAFPTADEPAPRPEPEPEPEAVPVEVVARPDPDPIEVAEQPAEEIVITRAASSGNGLWGVSLGRYPSRHSAERLLLQTALAETGSLGRADREVQQRPGGFEARFGGMTRDEADLACARLMVRNVVCSTFGPQG